MAFVHLHVHTEYSLLDGACRIEKMMDTAVELGQNAVAMTDHGVMYGAVDFYKAAKKRGLKPIIGCEVYVAKRTRHDKVHGIDRENRHLVLLCKNEIGYKNLIAMVSKSFTQGFYNNPRVDFELLEKHSEGLIALSACLAGEIPRAINAGDYKGAKQAALRYSKIFGKDNFYLEIQDHGLKEQKYSNPQIIALSKETGIPLVMTNDCHYILPEDSKMHHILICIQTNKTVEDDDTLEFGSNEFYFKSEEEMRQLFPNVQEAADNTQIIANRCNFEFEFGNTKLPGFKTPDGSDNLDFFKKLCTQGLVRRYGEFPTDTHLKRLSYEMSVIESMGYVNYFLIVYDFIRHARTKGIPVGPGRGSGVGSIVAYCMGITGVDPIKYDLIFERFLNPERVSMPDFDVDFSDERRHEIIDYVVEKYGADHVAQIVTFGTMAARLAIRDVARAMALPYNVADSAAKLIPMAIGMTIDKAMEQEPELLKRYEEDPKMAELINMARKVEGMPRHASTHAAGVVITKDTVDSYVPLAKNDESIVTQFTMVAIEELGLLKMDFLGLRNLSVIDNASQMVREYDKDFSIDKIKHDDKKTLKLIANGYTEGVFQFESGGMRRTIMRSAPNCLEDLIAVISLYRPGPMQFIDMYIENRHNPSKIQYRHPMLSKILNVTYGCIIYQEQVMSIFRELAGYSLGRADIVRRAMSKKKFDVMEKERKTFIFGEQDEQGNWVIEGCVNKGVSEEIAQAIFKEMESFAAYAFPKGHAAAYALVAYQTAYMKLYYPKEYMAALLTSVLGNSAKVAAYMEECHRLEIGVLPPHVNYSQSSFTVSEMDIRFGLLAVKNLGKGVIQGLVEERTTGGEFKSFSSFCRRMQGKELNKRAVESLIKAGALDGLQNNRREMLINLAFVMESLDADRRRNIEGQLGFFGTSGEAEEFVIHPMEDFPQADKLSMEKEVTGMYLSGHPMAMYKQLYEKEAVARIDVIAECAAGESDKYKDEQRVDVLVIAAGVKKKFTKNNKVLAFITAEDMYGSMEVIVFPVIFEKYSTIITEGAMLKIHGRLSFTEEREPKLICDYVVEPQNDSALIAMTKPEEKPSKNGLYLKITNNALAEKAMELVELFGGSSNLFIFYTDTKKLMKAPEKYKVNINNALLTQLKKLLGEENVAVKE